MKIGIYAISLNEEIFAERFATSVTDADCVLVADTGSTDGTVAILNQHGIQTVPITIRPWRFDIARNTALALLPADLDVVISLDLDEIMTDGWREHVERNFTGTRMRYGFVWSWTVDHKPDVSFMSEKITGRFTHRWKHPVHEILVPTVPETISVCHHTLVEHYPDSTRARSQYLSLLKLAVEEDPHDDRNCHYLGREFFFYRQYPEAIAELTRHLALPRATWKPERASSMRYIAKCYEAQGEVKAATEWFMRATFEDESRDTLIDAARYHLAQNSFYATIDLCNRALALTENPGGNYMTERYPHNEGPYDLSAVAYFHLGQRKIAIGLAKEALRRNPHDQRLRTNLKMMGDHE